MSQFVPVAEKAPLPAPTADTVGMVYEVLVPYAEVTHSKRAIEHPLRMAALAEDLIGPADRPRSLHPIAMGALWFHDLIDEAHRGLPGKNAREALRHYTETLEPEQKDYFDDILGDLPYVEEQAETYRRAAVNDNSELDEALRETSYKNRPLSPETWMAEPGSMPVDQIERVVEEVNVEAILIKAIELIDNLQNPSSKDVALRQDTYEAMYFYVPTIKYLSYYHPRLESIASLLDSEAKLRCLEKAGLTEYIDAAAKTLDALDSDVMRGSLRALLSGVAKTVHVDEDGITNVHGLHDLQMSEIGLMGLEGYDDSMELLPGNQREKSKGSLAWKRYKDRHLPKPPVDVGGVTILAPDRERVAVVLRPFIQLAMTNPDFQFIAGGSRSEYVSVKGDTTFVEQVTTEIAKYYDGAIDTPDEPKAHESTTEAESKNEELETVDQLPEGAVYTVAKVTIAHTVAIDGQWVVIPYEVQAQSRVDYKSGRIGDLAHGRYKSPSIAANEEQDLDQIGESIAQRVRHLGKGITNPSSRERGEQAAKSYRV